VVGSHSFLNYPYNISTQNIMEFFSKNEHSESSSSWTSTEQWLILLQKDPISIVVLGGLCFWVIRWVDPTYFLCKFRLKIFLILILNWISNLYRQWHKCTKTMYWTEGGLRGQSKLLYIMSAAAAADLKCML